MQSYSLPNLIRRGLRGHRGWTPAWRKAEPKPSYDVVIVGGGGHGLATAYYLASVHGVRNVAVLERGWLGGGSVGRNTAIVRSNYLWDASAHIYEFSLKLWEDLSRELNYNVMFSQRGVLNLGHSEQEMRDLARRVGANRLNGIDAELLSTEQIASLVPVLNTSPDTRYPVLGGSLQRRGGVARHDAVAWGYARGADALGVDIVESCEVTGIRCANGRVTALETTRGEIRAGTVGLVVAGNASVVAGMAGIQLPIESHPLQALVTEPLKPVLDPVVMSAAVHVYVSQTDRGELVLGAGIDAQTSYDMRGSFRIIEHTLAAVVELFPIFSRVRMVRQWAGTVDVCPDASPIISGTPIQGPLYQLRLGYRRLQGHARVGLGLRAHARPPGTASPQRAVFAGPFRHGRIDRRARRGRRGPLTDHAADPLPLVRTTRGRRVQLRRGGRYPASRRPRGDQRRGLGRLPLHARQPPRAPP